MNELTKHCERHGAYQSRRMSFKLGDARNDPSAPAEVRYTGCPACYDEQIKQIEQDRVKLLSVQLEQSIMDKQFADAGLLKRFRDVTLDEFELVTDAHRDTLANVREYLESIVLGTERDPHDDKLILCGLTGTGKTHLASAVARQFMLRTRRTARYYKVAALCDRVRDEQGLHHSMTALLPKLFGTGLVILDEVGSFGSDKEFQKAVVTEAIDYCNNNEYPIILISNLPEEDLSKVLGDVAGDRLNDGHTTVVSMVFKSYRGQDQV